MTVPKVSIKRADVSMYFPQHKCICFQLKCHAFSRKFHSNLTFNEDTLSSWIIASHSCWPDVKSKAVNLPISEPKMHLSMDVITAIAHLILAMIV